MQVKIKRGKEAALPILSEGELALATDTKKVYVGTSEGNIVLNEAGTSLVNILDGNNTGAVRTTGAKSDYTMGPYALAEGNNTTASGDYSHAEGRITTALGNYSHSEGNCTIALGIASHSEGYMTTACSEQQLASVEQLNANNGTFIIKKYSTNIDDFTPYLSCTNTIVGLDSHFNYTSVMKVSAYDSVNHIVTVSDFFSAILKYIVVTGYPAFKLSHAEGNRTTASGGYSHSEGNCTTASGDYSHAEGRITTASGPSSHAEGNSTTASGPSSHAEGNSTTASGDWSHAEGSDTTATGRISHSEGYMTTASGPSSHAEGSVTTATGSCSHAEGFDTKASGLYSHAGGYCTEAKIIERVIGHYNVVSTSTGSTNNTAGNAYIIGNGTSDSAKSNCFRVQYNGQVFSKGAYSTSGADYAELFEWEDGNPHNEDRRGLMVALHRDKIKIATSADDNIIGIISSNPAVIGNNHSETWQGMYLTDMWGDVLTEYKAFPAEYRTEEYTELDEDGQEVKKTRDILIHEAYETDVPIVNPDYNADESYIPRHERKEWGLVGMFGQLIVKDDGTCEAGGYCQCVSDGMVGKADKGYYVMKRIANNYVLVLFR